MTTEYRRKAEAGTQAGEWRTHKTTAIVDAIDCGGTGQDEQIEMRSVQCAEVSLSQAFKHASEMTQDERNQVCRINEALQTKSIIHSGMSTPLLKKLIADWKQLANIKDDK